MESTEQADTLEPLLSVGRNGVVSTLNRGVIRAIQAAGGTQEKLAAALGVHQRTVSYWLRVRVPAARAAQIEERLGIPAWEMAPQIFKRREAA